MKKYLLLPVLLLALCGISLAQSGYTPQPGDVKIISINPSGQKTPQYTLGVGPIKRSDSLTWLEVEVQFATLPENIDELTFEYSILLGNQLLTGSVTHVDIAKGNDHYSVVYVSPKSIAKILGKSPLTNSAIQNIWVRVTRRGQELAAKSFKPGNIPNAPQQAGMVMNKMDTPFAPLFWDRYEQTKPSSH